MKYLISAFVLSAVLLSTAQADSSNLEKYKQAYVQQITPLVKQRFTKELEKEENPEERLAFVANGLADCQIETISTYPQKYRDASINPVAEGKGLELAAQQVNEMMKADIDSGAISEDEFQALIENATRQYSNCTLELEEQLKSTSTQTEQ